MSLLASVFLLLAAFSTAAVSGVLGMAGGLLLLGCLLLVLPAVTAFVAHGLLQLVSIGWRAVLHRRHVRWPVVGWYAVGAALAAGLLAATQVLSHTAKVVVYGGPLLAGGGRLPGLVLALAVPLSMLGTVIGGRILDRLSDAGFRSMTRWVVTAIGAAYLVQAARLA